MATLKSFTSDKTSIPAGGQALLTVTFTTDPGTQPRTLHVSVTLDGAPVTGGELDVAVPGTSAEPTPSVQIGTGSGWRIVTDSGTLTAGANPNTFILRP